MFQLDAHPSGRHFLQIPGPTNVPDRVLRAIDQPTIDHRGPEFARLDARDPRRPEGVFQTDGAGRHLSGVGHRRVGGGARQHAVARRPRADVRDRPVRHAVARDGRASSASSSTSSRATGAAASIPRWSRRSSPRTARTRSRRCCVVHNETSTGVTSRIPAIRAGDRPRRPSRAADGRHDLVARVDRLPARRVGRRRHRRRLAEGPDAAAGPVVQRGQRQGARRQQDGEAAALVLGLGRDASR